MYFHHPFASGSRRREVKAQDGTIKRVLTITARIVHDPSKPGYDQQKDSDLQVAAVEFSKSLGDVFDTIEFEQGFVDA
jgi:hypothetical protein